MQLTRSVGVEVYNVRYSDVYLPLITSSKSVRVLPEHGEMLGSIVTKCLYNTTMEYPEPQTSQDMES